MRVKLFVLFLFVTLAVTLTTLVSVKKASKDLGVTAHNVLQSAKEVIRLENRVGDYSLLASATEIAELDSVLFGMKCPVTEEELQEQNREQIPQMNAEGQPVLDQAERPLDTNGEPMREQNDSRCQTTQHSAVYEVLRAWNNERTNDHINNGGGSLSDRDIGMALASENGPTLLMIANENGEIVARVGFDMQGWYGPNRPNMETFPVVARTREYGYQHDIIAWANHETEPKIMTHVGVAPIFDENEEFIGSVIIGEAMTNDWAEDDLWPLYNVDLAYVMEDDSNIKFQGTSMTPQFRSSLQEATFLELLPDGETADESVSLEHLFGIGLGGVYQFELNDQKYLLTTSAYANTRADQSNFAGFVVVVSVDQFVAPLNQIKKSTPLVAIVVLLLSILGILLLYGQFVAPLEEISSGIQEVIAGKKDYMWPVDEKSRLSDLAHSLNIMSARLQGKRDPDSEDLDGQNEWAGLVGKKGSGNTKAVKGAVVGIGGGRLGRRPKKSGGNKKVENNKNE